MDGHRRTMQGGPRPKLLAMPTPTYCMLYIYKRYIYTVVSKRDISRNVTLVVMLSGARRVGAGYVEFVGDGARAILWTWIYPENSPGGGPRPHYDSSSFQTYTTFGYNGTSLRPCLHEPCQRRNGFSYAADGSSRQRNHSLF